MYICMPRHKIEKFEMNWFSDQMLNENPVNCYAYEITILSTYENEPNEVLHTLTNQPTP
jgi:hypothetical protein